MPSTPENVAIGAMNLSIIAVFGYSESLFLRMRPRTPEPARPANIIVIVVAAQPIFMPARCTHARTDLKPRIFLPMLISK